MSEVMQAVQNGTDISRFLQDTLHLNMMTSEAIAAVIVFSIVAVIGWVSYYIFGRYFSVWAKKTQSTLDDDILHNVKTIVILLIVVVGTYNALTSLTFTAAYSGLIYNVFTIVSILLVAFAITRVVTVLSDWFVQRQTKRNGEANNHVFFLLKKILQIVVLGSALIAILYALGYNLSGIVVGLGVGGIAIALAVQNTLSDVFSAFSIYFDRPFQIGDFVVIGDQAGTVTSIGIKSTRLKLLQGEELVISNQELTSAQVRNFKKLQKRRVVFTIGVVYGTPSEKLKKIPKIVGDIIKATDFAELDRVHFYEFGDFSLKFEIVYYVSVGDYVKYMDTQQAINFAIKEAFEKEDIEMAFPTQTIFMSK
ncbi:MAG: mechanosensitive ion channel family protein [Candidatus Bathyarchaeota archaeon]|nr:mechanosensitive ion channel family protein [Candidatus Bathyarchaeota archaeon]